METVQVRAGWRGEAWVFEGGSGGVVAEAGGDVDRRDAAHAAAQSIIVFEGDKEAGVHGFVYS
jgi:hypothetical protein